VDFSLVLQPRTSITTYIEYLAHPPRHHLESHDSYYLQIPIPIHEISNKSNSKKLFSTIVEAEAKMEPNSQFSSSRTDISWSLSQARVPSTAPPHFPVHQEPEEILRGEFRGAWRTNGDNEIYELPGPDPCKIPSPMSSSQANVFAGSLDPEKGTQLPIESSYIRTLNAACPASKIIQPTIPVSSDGTRTSNSRDPGMSPVTH
jgi:hypothetical protein